MNISSEHIVIGAFAAYILYNYYNEKDIEKDTTEHLSLYNPTNYSNIDQLTNTRNPYYTLPNQVTTTQSNYNINIPKQIPSQLPQYSKDTLNNIMNTGQLNKVCKMPDKKTAACVTDMLVNTGCVKCSLESCDKHHTISASCYENEEHSCNDGYKMYENMHDSLHDNQFNSVHSSLYNNVYNPMKLADSVNYVPSNSNISGNTLENNLSCNLEETNNVENLLQKNISILGKGHGNNSHYGKFGDQQDFQIENYNHRPINQYAQSTVPQDIALGRALDGSFVKYSRLG